MPLNQHPPLQCRGCEAPAGILKSGQFLLLPRGKSPFVRRPCGEFSGVRSCPRARPHLQAPELHLGRRWARSSPSELTLHPGSF